jgi:hypothetical protein
LSRDYRDQRVIERLRELKPKYSDIEASSALNDLRSKGFAKAGQGS